MKNGFTLAEVLITLVIIGVVAAMTISQLIQTTSDQEYVSRLKKLIPYFHKYIQDKKRKDCFLMNGDLQKATQKQ